MPRPVGLAPQPARDGWIFWILVVLVFWLPVPWGSRPPAATALFGFAVAALTCARLALGALPPLGNAARLAIVAWLAWLAWNEAHVLWLSIAPGASVDQLILGANLLCLFWLVIVTTARNRKRQRAVLMTLVSAGVAQALYGSVMTLSGVEYGFLGHKDVGIGWATGTFVNRNHLAGYLELAMAAGIALVLADLRSGTPQTWRQLARGLLELLMSPRMRVRVMIAIMVVALVLTRSRMGNVAFFVALAVCGNVYILLRQPKYFLKSLLFFVSLFAVDLLIVSKQYGLEKVAERLQNTEIKSEQRWIALQDLRPLLDQYWLTGSGPGTFGDAFSPQRSAQLVGYFDHAHNDFLEFLIEAGVVGCAPLALIVGVTLVHGFLVVRRRSDPTATALAFAGVMGLVALGIHGLADFNLRIPAVAATLVVLMALSLSVSSKSSRAAGREPAE